MRSDDVRFLHPRGDVPACVQHAPRINVIWALDIEHEVGKSCQQPGPQSRQIEFMAVAWRTGRRMATDVGVGLLQRVKKSQRSLLSAFVQVVLNGVFDVPVGQRPGNDGFGFYLDAPALATLRTRARKPSK